VVVSLRRKLMMRLGAQMMARVNLGEDVHEVIREYTSGTHGLFMLTDADREHLNGMRDPVAAAHDVLSTYVGTAGGWAVNGWPLLVPSHKLAALLMATKVPAEVADDIVFPWDKFAIDVPDGLCTWGSFNGRPNDVRHVVLTHRKGGQVSLYMQNELHGLPVAVVFKDLADCCSAVEYGDGEEDGPALTTEGRALNRICAVIGRLALGLCIELDKPKHRLVIGEGRPKQPRRFRGEPKAWTFQLTRDVKVDCREWVKDFIRGGTGTSPSVQTLVRGHHKRQPCGPGRTERKWIHVEPYWRGPEDAPIAVRSHRVAGAEVSP
jgi:hypothetical protein